MALVSRAMAVSWREITQNNAHGKIISVALNLFKHVAWLSIHLHKACGNAMWRLGGGFSFHKSASFAVIRDVFRFLFIIFVAEIL